MSTLSVVAPACGWAALTTILGFLTLASARLATIQNFGLLCALAVALTFGAVLLLLPALCSLSGLSFAKKGSPESSAGNNNRLHELWMRFTQRVIQQPGGYCIVGCILIVVMLAMAANLEPAIGISEALPGRGKTLAAWKNVEAKFGGVLPVTLVIQWKPESQQGEILDVMSAAHQAMEYPDMLSRPLSMMSLLVVFRASRWNRR